MLKTIIYGEKNYLVNENHYGNHDENHPLATFIGVQNSSTGVLVPDSVGRVSDLFIIF